MLIETAEDTSPDSDLTVAEQKREAFLSRMEKVGAEPGDEDDTDDTDTDEPDDDSETTDEDTDSDRDDDAGESDDDAEEDADDEDTADSDEEDDESDDDSDVDGEDEDEDDEDVSEETRAALKGHGADLTIDDVPEKFRPLVLGKLKSMDAAFTRKSMELSTALREARSYEADKRYQTDNPDLAIVEMIQRDPKILDRVNARLAKFDGEDETTIADNKAVLDEVIRTKKNAAAEAIAAAEREAQSLADKGTEIVTYAQKAAAKAGVPFNTTLQRLLASEIRAKPPAEQKKGLTSAEIDAVVKDYARDHSASVRAHKREASKKQVAARSAPKGPKAAPKPPRSAAGPGPSRERKVAVNHNDRDARMAAGMRIARRILPGVRDR